MRKVGRLGRGIGAGLLLAMGAQAQGQPEAAPVRPAVPGAAPAASDTARGPRVDSLAAVRPADTLPVYGRLKVFVVDTCRGTDMKADILVDGVKVGTTPFDGKVRLGASIKADAHRFGTWTLRPDLREDRMALLPLRMCSVPEGMQVVKAGCFTMGSEKGNVDEKPARKTCLSEFDLDITEVTQGEYRKVMGNNPSRNQACGDECPVERVNWYEASEFCRRVGKRLPTEAEWEYAARAGSRTEFAWGDDTLPAHVGQYAWYGENSRALPDSVRQKYSVNVSRLMDTAAAWKSMTHPVGQKEPNDWLLQDMAGNVWEWTADWKALYPAGEAQDPKGPASGLEKVVRGGSWNYGVQYLRTANRGAFFPNYRNYALGFRCAYP